MDNIPWPNNVEVNKMYKILSGLALLLVFSVTTSCHANDDSKETSMYQSVHAKQLFDKGTLIIHEYNRGGSPDYIIDGNVLYLKIQTTYNKDNIYIVADTQSWDSSRLKILLSSNPAIKILLPEPNSNNGGIAWLNNK
jgi:hypothetical protein